MLIVAFDSRRKLIEISKKNSEEKKEIELVFFVMMTHVACQSFRERSLWMRQVIRPGLKWKLRSLMNNSGMKIAEFPKKHFNSI